MSGQAAPHGVDGHLIDDLAELGAQMPKWRIVVARALLSASIRGDFYEQLGILLDATAGEAESLAEIWMIITRKGRRASFIFSLFNPLIVAIPVWLYGMIGEGLELDRALRPWLPRMEGQTLTSYYRRGLKGELLYEQAKDARTEAEWTGKVIAGALPLASAALIVLLMGYLAATQFFPGILRSIPRSRLTGQILAAKEMSDFLLQYGQAVLCGIGLLPVLVPWSFPRWTGRIRTFFDHAIWPYTMYRKYTSVKWLRALAAQVDAGEDDHKAVESMLDHATPYLRERLEAVVVRDELSLGDALAESGYEWPDSATIANITIALRSGQPGPVLKGIADRRMKLLSGQMDRAADAASMAGTLVVGLFIIWITVVINDIASVTNQLSTIPVH